MTKDQLTNKALLHPNPAVRNVAKELSEYITKMQSLFAPHMRITVYVRQPGHIENDLFITNDENPETMVEQLKTRIAVARLRGNMVDVG